MIRKLRTKFTAAAMLSLLIVLAVLMGAVNLYNYHSIVRQADETLSMLSENRGRFPGWMMGAPEAWERLDENEQWYAESPPHGGRERRDVSPELAFESRYFSVLVKESAASVLDLEHIAAVDETSAAEMAESVAKGNRTSGFSGAYRYSVTELEDGVLVTFLDCSRDLSTFRGFLWASVVVSLAGLAAALGLMVLFSGRFTRPMAESYEKQRRFITDAGHEIKTPITIIDADAELLALDLPDSEWLADIRTQTKRLTDLTNDLIFLSKMDEELQLQRIDFPLSDMAEEAATSFRSRALRENKRFEVSIEPMLTYCGEEKTLRQLVNILLDNALKYSPEGGEVSFKLESAPRSVHLLVENTCDTVPEGELNDLFDRFYRAEKSRNSSTGGHGLGLSIAKAVVSAHKGKISASSPAEHRMRFDVLLPI